jgi:hypothetical protein
MSKCLIRIAIAVFFVCTSLFKMYSFPQFISSVNEFQLLPYDVIFPFSIFILLTELIAGLGIGMNMYVKPFSIFLILLLCVFTIAIIHSLLNNHSFDCGCFGVFLSSRISWWSVVRNIFLGSILFRILIDEEKKT